MPGTRVPDGRFDGRARKQGECAIFAGEMPMKRGDRIVGAVGVSGGGGDQEQAVADAAVAAL
jgi:uncharacterized protein GlcG (DUF336 family)